MPGPQSARVVGVADAAVSPSRDHQVRIQFPWQRGAQPTPGGLTDSASAAPGHADHARALRPGHARAVLRHVLSVRF